MTGGCHIVCMQATGYRFDEMHPTLAGYACTVAGRRDVFRLQGAPSDDRRRARLVSLGVCAHGEPATGGGGGGGGYGGGEAAGGKAIAHVLVRRRGVVPLQPDQAVRGLARGDGSHIELQRNRE